MRFSIASCTLLTAVLSALGPSATAQDAAKEKAIQHDLEKLQGEWKMVRCESDGAARWISSPRF